jgi:hypothetical protein
MSKQTNEAKTFACIFSILSIVAAVSWTILTVRGAPLDDSHGLGGLQVIALVSTFLAAMVLLFGLGALVVKLFTRVRESCKTQEAKDTLKFFAIAAIIIIPSSPIVGIILFDDYVFGIENSLVARRAGIIVAPTAVLALLATYLVRLIGRPLLATLANRSWFVLVSRTVRRTPLVQLAISSDTP